MTTKNLITLSSIDKKFASWRNADGLVSPDRDHQPLFHGFYLLVLEKHGLLSQARDANVKLLSQLIHPEFPGLLLPRPGRAVGNLFSHDTHRAMVWAAHTLAMPFAKDFLDHGTNHNPAHPKKWAMRGTYWRFPSLWAAAHIAARRPPHPNYWALAYNEMWLAGRTGYSRRVEKVTLGVFNCRTLSGVDSHMDRVVYQWQKKKLLAYPGGLGEVLQNWGGPWRNSPFVDELWGVI